MNNSRYLMLMDFAQLDYLARIGLTSAALRRRWIVPVAMAQVDFYRPLKPLENFEIDRGGTVTPWPTSAGAGRGRHGDHVRFRPVLRLVETAMAEAHLRDAPVLVLTPWSTATPASGGDSLRENLDR